MSKILLILAALLLPVTWSTPTLAASQDDCAIWLCLPTGFPSGCGKAKSAFLKRVRKFKPPLPNIASCLIKKSEIPPEIRNAYPPSELSYKEGVAAKMPASYQCTKYIRRYGNLRCAATELRESYYIDGIRCRLTRDDEHWVRKPDGCQATYHWVQTYIDGKPNGNKYYYTY